LTKAFTGVEGVFLLTPPLLHIPNQRAHSLKIVHNFINAIKNAKVKKVVYLSSVGAHLSGGTGPIANTHDFENEIFKLDVPTAGLRAAYFFENVLSNYKAAQQYGQVYSLNAHGDQAYPQVATIDIGRIAATTLAQEWSGHRIIDVHGPKPYSAHEIFKIISETLKKEVKIITVPPENYEATLKGFGLTEEGAAAMAELYRGFNSGYLKFEGKAEEVHGPTTFEEFLASQK